MIIAIISLDRFATIFTGLIRVVSLNQYCEYVHEFSAQLLHVPFFISFSTDEKLLYSSIDKLLSIELRFQFLWRAERKKSYVFYIYF